MSDGQPVYRAIFERIREWYIVAIGAVLVIGGLYLASPVPETLPLMQSAGVQSAPEQTQAASDPQEEALSTAAADNGAAKQEAPPATPQPQAVPATPPPQSQPDSAQQDHSQMVAQAPSAAASASQMNVAGDPAKGEQVFKKCRACHSVEAGKNTVGPSLAGVFGRKAGEVQNYNYSPAMKTSNIVWDAAALDSYIHDPKGFLPGNKMAFPGLKNEPERTNVIAYLASLSAPQQQGAAPAPQPQAPAQSAPQPQAQAQQPQAPAQPVPQPEAQAQEQGEAAAPAPDASQSSASYIPDVRYTLRSGIAEGRMVFLGVGGAIDAQVNPILSAAEGQVVQITLLNGEGAEHDVVFPDFDAKSPRIVGRGSSTTLVFRAGRAGDFVYICSVPGHQLAGMEGQFVVTARPAAPAPVEADISQKPTEVPPPIGNREPQRIRVDLLTVELEGRLAEGTTFGYWTFNGRVPGPMIRVRVGDTLEVHLKNGEDSGLIHSVDFHAATGPGGGAAATQADPGQEKSFKFKALVPGLYVYHCATPMVAHHIANGMYGLILVEPEGGLPPVDREFYVMQGEIYTQAEFGQHGPQEFSVEKLLNERPEYFVFNGAVGALSKLHTLKAKVGETVRIYFGVGGPNYTSSFHVIGEIFDRVYNLADVMSPPARGIQTVTVPAGGATIVEFKLDVPGNYILVDHALSRAERGLIGILQAEGPPNPDIFEGVVDPGAGH